MIDFGNTIITVTKYANRCCRSITTPRPDTHFISSLYIAKNQRGQLNVKVHSLVIACGL
jgi:hypothetical protein